MWLAEARQREEWAHTSSLAAVMINLKRPKGKRPVNAWELNPFRPRPQVDHSKLPQVKIDALKVFLPPKQQSSMRHDQQGDSRGARIRRNLRR